MGSPFVKRPIAAELGPNWQRRFASFERAAASAASLGQVHKATGHDGRQLACKLQYPDMMSAVEADLGQLNLIFSIYERYDRTISTKQIHAEISARLREELDYALEARHTALYRDILSPVGGVQVPEVVADLSTKRLLTMTWLEGRKILDYVKEHPEHRNELALNMFRAWYTPLYICGSIHGDALIRNYTDRTDA